MGHHHKAASCSAIPSFQSFTSVSTSSTQAPSLNLFDHDYIKQHQHQQSNLKKSIIPSLNKSSSQHSIQQQQLFPLPSFCLYSKRALTNEYAPETDIIQFLSPASPTLEERLPMFVGVLHSLFTVVNDMPFINEHDEDSEDDGEEDDGEEDEDENNNSQSDDEDDISNSNNDIDDMPFTIIGLNTMKLVIWNNMYNNIVDMDVYEKDLCLVVMVTSQVSDNTILDNMKLLRESVISSTTTTTTTVTANQMGEQLIPLIEYWFDTQ